MQLTNLPPLFENIKAVKIAGGYYFLRAILTRDGRRSSRVMDTPWING